MAVSDNLKKLLEALNMSQRQFAQALYLDPGYFSKIIQGKMPLNSRLQLLIENTFRVNGEWLRTGEGDMFQVPMDSAVKTRVLEQIEGLSEAQLLLLESFITQYFHSEKAINDR